VTERGGGQDAVEEEKKFFLQWKKDRSLDEVHVCEGPKEETAGNNRTTRTSNHGKKG